MAGMNVGIVGIGRIASKYLKPIQDNERFNLLALCDLNESAKQASEEFDILFYTDYKKMLENDKLDIVIITTPPITHFEIVKNCLLNKKNVILEKPAVLNMDELEVLYQLAEDHRVTLDVVFHWKFGKEVLYLKRKLKDFGEIKRIESTVFDPYTDNNFHIKGEYISLQGSWYDSGINCLSLFSSFYDISQLKLLYKDYIYDEKSGLDLYSKHLYAVNDTEFSITVDWRYNMNHKYTRIYFEKDILYMDHSRESIWLNNELLIDLRDGGDRLETHYRNYFAMYSEELINHKEIHQIHSVLLRDK